MRNIGPIPNCMRKYSNTFDTYPVSRDRQARRPFITCLSRSQCGLDCCPCCMFGTLRQLAVWYRLTILQHCYSVGNRHGKRYSMRTDMLRSFVEGMQSCIVHESPGRLGQPTAGLWQIRHHNLGPVSQGQRHRARPKGGVPSPAQLQELLFGKRQAHAAHECHSKGPPNDAAEDIRYLNSARKLKHSA